MKKYLFLLIILAFWMTDIRAQLVISSNTTWSTNQILTQAVVINPGVTLTINEGVIVETVFVDANTNNIGDIDITVNGKLVTKGTQCNPVVFRPLGSPTNGSDHWNGIIVNSSTLNDSLDFFTIEYARGGLNLQSNSNVTGVDIQNCPTGVRNQSTSTSTISESFIHDNERSGIINYGGTLTVNNSHIHTNAKFGLVTNNGTLIAGFCDINENSWGGVFVGGSANIDIQNSEIYDNTGNGIEVSDWSFTDDFLSPASSTGNPTVVVTNNNIWNNAATTFNLTLAESAALTTVPNWGDCMNLISIVDQSPNFEIPIGYISSQTVTGTRFYFNDSYYNVIYRLRDAHSNSNISSFTHTTWTPSDCGFPSYYAARTFTFTGNTATDMYYWFAQSNNTYHAVYDASTTLRLGGFEVYCTVEDNAPMTFTGNYWGQIVGVDLLLRNVDSPNIDYAGYLTSAIPGIGTTIGSGLPVVDLGPDALVCDSVTTVLDAQNGGASFAWSTSENTQSIDVMDAPGTYWVDVTNACGTTRDSIVITNDPWPELPNAPTGQTVLCQNSINTNYTTTGATNATSYYWEISPASAGTISGTGSVGTVDWDANFSGVATIRVSGVNGCGTGNASSISVIINGLPTDPVVGDTDICFGESTTLTASGGNTYSWNTSESTASITVSPAVTTVYTVTVTDANTCQGSTDVTVTVDTPPTVVASGATSVCSGSSVSLSASGANTYTWDNGGGSGSTVSVSPLATTTYTVIGTSVGGCTGTDQITVAVNSNPSVTAAGTATVCSGASAGLSASGASTYSWDNGGGTGSSVTVSPTSTTTYTVIGTDANGCTNTDQVTVTVNALPTVSASGISAICTGSNANLSASGASTYTWNNGAGSGSSVTVSPTSTTTYTVTGTDGNGCVNTDQVTVTVNALPTVSASGTASICIGSSTVLSASGASTYAWDNGGGSGSSVSVSPSSTTTYTVTGTSASGCTNFDQVTVTVNSLPSITASGGTAICQGASTTVSASGGSTYTWDNGAGNGSSVVVSPASTITYTVTGTDANGCTNMDQVTVSVNANPTVSASGSVTICEGATTPLLASGASTYVWDNGAGSGSSVNVSPSTTTIYSVTGTDANGCTSTDQVTVTVNPAPTVVASGVTSICIGNSAVLNASGASTYTWDNGAGTGSSVTVAPSSTTAYTVTGTDATGCQGMDQITVTVNALPNVTASGTATICEGESVFLTGGGANTYDWDNGAGSGSIISVSPGSTTIYTVTGTDVNGCENTAQVAVTVNSLPVVSSSGDVTICEGESTVLMVSGASTYNWDNSAGSGSSVSVSPTFTTVYIVTGIDANGCENTDQLTVTVNDLPVVGVTQNDTTLTATNSSGVSYQWIDCDNGNSWLSGETSQSYEADQNGNYAVIVTDSGTGCSDTSSCYQIEVIGLDSFDALSQVYLHPNPARDYFNIVSDYPLEQSNIELISVDGRVIEAQPVTLDNGVQINVSELTSGTYFVRLLLKGQSQTLKFIKE